MKTTVVHCRVESYDVYIGRGKRGHVPKEIMGYGWLGNPFPVDMNIDTPIGIIPIGRDLAIAMFKRYFYERISMDSKYKEAILKLKGKTLGCYCSPKACHGQVYDDYEDEDQYEPLPRHNMKRNA